MSDAAGLRVIVTGASSGLGEAAARALSQAGARVAVVARREDRVQALARDLDGVAIAADVAAPGGAARIVGTAAEVLGGVDALVNAAGTTNVARALVEDLDEVRRVLEVNLLGAYGLAQQAASAMKSTGGAIVNVASIMAGSSEPTIPQAGYVASKGGLVSLTRELAVQWGRYGIRCNTLVPGWFPTEMTADLVADTTHASAMAERIPLRRFGDPSEIGGPVVFLCSPASSYMTGQVLVVDGGMTCV